MACGQPTRGREFFNINYVNGDSGSRRTVFLNSNGLMVLAVRSHKWGTSWQYTYKALPLSLSRDLAKYLIYIRPLEIELMKVVSGSSNENTRMSYSLFHSWNIKLRTKEFTKTMDVFADDYLKVKRLPGSGMVGIRTLRHAMIHVGRTYLVPSLNRKELQKVLDLMSGHSSKTAESSYGLFHDPSQQLANARLWVQHIEISILHHRFFGLETVADREEREMKNMGVQTEPVKGLVEVAADRVLTSEDYESLGRSTQEMLDKEEIKSVLDLVEAVKDEEFMTRLTMGGRAQVKRLVSKMGF
jgi:hypothetical protein